MQSADCPAETAQPVKGSYAIQYSSSSHPPDRETCPFLLTACFQTKHLFVARANVENYGQIVKQRVGPAAVLSSSLKFLLKLLVGFRFQAEPT